MIVVAIVRRKLRRGRPTRISEGSGSMRPASAPTTGCSRASTWPTLGGHHYRPDRGVGGNAERLIGVDAAERAGSRSTTSSSPDRRTFGILVARTTSRPPADPYQPASVGGQITDMSEVQGALQLGLRCYSLTREPAGLAAAEWSIDHTRSDSRRSSRRSANTHPHWNSLARE